MTREEWQIANKIDDECMELLVYLVNDGCKITNVFNYDWNNFLKLNKKIFLPSVNDAKSI